MKLLWISERREELGNITPYERDASKSTHVNPIVKMFFLAKRNMYIHLSTQLKFSSATSIVRSVIFNIAMSRTNENRKG